MNNQDGIFEIGAELRANSIETRGWSLGLNAARAKAIAAPHPRQSQRSWGLLSAAVLAVVVPNLLGVSASLVQAQEPIQQAPSLSPEQIEQIVAPIALHPDALVSQILMASTYPLEVIQADRWVKANPEVSGTALESAMESQTWDPSVKSLVTFPQVLSMMSEKLDWMTQLGDAFLAQQQEVLATIQRLRAKARDAGNLQSSEQLNVVVEPASSTQTQTIVIQSTSPDVVYVPAYNPTVVYGAWPYPAYPPYYYRPPGYPIATAAVSFGVGVAVGAAWGYAWGDCHWGRGDVDINVNRNINRNTSIRNTNAYRNNVNRGGGSWNHDPSHRRGIAYRDSGTANRFNRGPSRQSSTARESFRGRAASDRRSLQNNAGRAGTGSRGRGAAASRSRSGSAAGRTSGSRSGSVGSRSTGSRSTTTRSPSRSTGRSGSALGRPTSGSSSRAASSRGRSSRSAGSRSSGSRSRSGGGRRR